jgi:predicted regulator of Ras-like GTPase activity (Roadblock/LC7/MglB family)
MQEILKSINTTWGVTGCFVCDTDGQVLESALPELFDDSTLSEIGRILSRTIEGLSSIRRGKVVDIDLVYNEHRFIAMNLGAGCLCILGVRNINLPLLTLSANMAVKKLAPLVAAQRTSAPPVTAPPTTAPPTTAKPASPKPESLPATGSSSLTTEIKAILTHALRQGVLLKATGDAAIRLRCPNSSYIALPLDDKVIDFAGLEKQAGQIKRAMDWLGYQPQERFNILQGQQRLRFTHPKKKLGVEIFLDELVMYHHLDFRDRLPLEDNTLPPADLLLWKLQYVDPDDTILAAIYTLLDEHELGSTGEMNKIDTSYLMELFSSDWGWYKTATLNLEKSITWAEKNTGAKGVAFIEKAIFLLQRINLAPKSIGWQLRSRLGESVRWYEVPE